MCIETGEVFENRKEMEKEIASNSCVRKALKDKKAVKGKHYKYVSEEDEFGAGTKWRESMKEVTITIEEYRELLISKGKAEVLEIILKDRLGEKDD